MNLLKILFISSLFFFIFGEIIRFDFGNGIFARPFDIVVGILFTSWIIYKIIRKKKIGRKSILVLISSFIVWGVFSLLINFSKLSREQFFVSLLYPVRWMVYAGMFFIVSDFDNDFKKKINNILIIVGSLIVFLGYVQYFLYSNLKNLFYLGWDEHIYRMFSVFLDPNFAGAFFVLFFLFLFNNYFQNRNKLLIFIIIFTLGAIFLTFSRSALIMLVVSASSMFFLLGKKKLILLLVLIMALVISISSRYSNIENINLFRSTSSEARLQTAGVAIKIFENNPILGVGFNAYRYAQAGYNLANSTVLIPSHSDATTDNSILFILATTGIVGFIIYALLWFNLLKNVSLLAVVSFVGVLVNSLFINSLFYPFIMFWLWIILALSIKKHDRNIG